MNSKIRELICLETQPVAVIKTDTMPDGALQFKEGATSGCMIGMLTAASKGRTAVFQACTTGCNGAKVGLGFAQMQPGPIVNFLSTGGPMPGEYYKKTPDLALEFVKGMPNPQPKSCLVLKPLNQVNEDETPVTVVFLVNADQLSGLCTLAHYDQPTQDTVVTRFGSGCAQSILFPMMDSEAGLNRCTIGITDPSARAHFDKDLLSFAIPYARFLEMEANAEESFLTKETWAQVKKRL